MHHFLYSSGLVKRLEAHFSELHDLQMVCKPSLLAFLLQNCSNGFVLEQEEHNFTKFLLLVGGQGRGPEGTTKTPALTIGQLYQVGSAKATTAASQTRISSARSLLLAG